MILLSSNSLNSTMLEGEFISQNVILLYTATN